jgi:hypothetical protein
VTNGPQRRRVSENVVIVGAPHPGVIRHQPPGIESPREVPITDLVKRADKYVSIVKGKAKLDPKIEAVMSDTEIAMVAHLVELYNSDTAQRFRDSVKGWRRPVPKRPPAPPADEGTSSTSQALGDPPPMPCTPHISIIFFWWGFRIRMDHCFCSLLIPIGGGVSAVAGVIALFMAATGLAGSVNPWLGLAAGLVATMIGWITWADNYCTPKQGANYNQTWTVQGWITTAC